MKRIKELKERVVLTAIIVFVAIVLTGCQTPPRVEYRVVDVPEPPLLTGCVSETAELPDTASDGLVIETLFSDYLRCRAKNEEALKALDAYRGPKSAK